jgi:hypothetical protein
VELEFDAATAAGIPRLVFVVDGDAPEFVAPQSFWADPMSGSRREAFRARVDEAGLVRARVSGPQRSETWWCRRCTSCPHLSHRRCVVRGSWFLLWMVVRLPGLSWPSN